MTKKNMTADTFGDKVLVCFLSIVSIVVQRSRAYFALLQSFAIPLVDLVVP
jgi:hypothetical protein